MRAIKKVGHRRSCTMKKAISIITLLGLTLFVMSGPALAQKLYKWVDEDGNVHYSDQVPPDQVKQAREELNDQGVVVERTARAPTLEELAEQRLIAAQQAAERKRIEALQREDTKLLLMYPSEEDIVRSRDQQVDAINRSIVAAEAYKEGQARSLAGLLERAAQAESQGNTVSEALKSSIESLQQQIAEQEEFIGGRETEKVKIVEEYDVLLARYREVRERNS